MNKGKIIYIGGFEMPDKNAAAHRVISNAKATQLLGYKTLFIGIHKKNKALVVREQHFGFDTYSKRYPRGIFDWLIYITQFSFYKKILKEQNDVKVIICYNLPSISIFLLARWARKNDVRIVADCTEWVEKSGKNILIRYAKTLDTLVRIHIVQPKLDGIIAISSFIENYYKLKRTKTVQIPPLTDTSDPKWEGGRSEKISGPINIVYFGTPFNQSSKRCKDRLDNLIVAFLSLKESYEFIFHIIGCERSQFLQFYQEFGEEVDTEVLKFYGEIPHRDAIDILKSSDFSIFVRDDTPNNRAGFPTKFAESISSGIPVITNKNSNVADYLKEGDNGFFIDCQTEKSLQRTLEKPLSIRKEDLFAMKRRIYESGLFDYRNYVNRFVSILEEDK